MKDIRQIRATLCLLLTAVIWGVAFVAQRAAVDYMGPFLFNGTRFALGVLSLLPVMLIFERSSFTKAHILRALPAGLAGGFVLFAAATLQQFGVQITGSAGKAGFITGLYIVLVPVFSLAFGRKAGRFVWIGVLFACGGLYFLSVPPGGFSLGLGDVVLLGGAAFWAAHILVIDHFSSRVSPLLFSAAQFAVCAILSLICAFVREDVSFAALYDGRVPLLYSALLSVGLAYTLQVVGQRYVEPAKAAVIFSLEALFSALGAALLLQEFMGTRGYIGCALIFAGNLISQIPVRHKKRSSGAP